MLRISSVYKGELGNLDISNFLDKNGTPQDDLMVPFYQCGEEWQLILDSGGFDLNRWIEIRNQIPEGLYLGKALVKVNLYGGTLMFPTKPELGSYEKGQMFGSPGVDIKRKHTGLQFVKFDLCHLLLPPKISISLCKTGEFLTPLGFYELGKERWEKSVRWQGMMNYTCYFGDDGKRILCPLFTWDLSDFLPDMIKAEFQDQTVLLVNKQMKIVGCYEQGCYFNGIPDHLSSVNTDIFSQIALMI